MTWLPLPPPQNQNFWPPPPPSKDFSEFLYTSKKRKIFVFGRYYSLNIFSGNQLLFWFFSCRRPFFRKYICKTISGDFVNHLFVALCDIGSAVFNYDMRRLNEILDVPKAWYKRGLMQRVFLGKEATFATSQSSTNQSKRSQSDSKPPTEPEELGTPKFARKTGNANMDSFFVLIIFVPSLTFLYPLETRENPTFFWCFQEIIEMKY